MTLETLENLNDEQLRAVIARAGELMRRHDKERKTKALTDARSILASAGLSLKSVAAKSRRDNTAKPPIYRSGHSYQHPTNPELVWDAKGKKPGWLRELEKQRSRAMELPVEAAAGAGAQGCNRIVTTKGWS